MPDATVGLIDGLDRLAEAVYTMAAIDLASCEHLSADQAAWRVAEQRHELRHALANWRPPRDSYRSADLER